MADTKFTPGPWRLSLTDDTTVIGPDHQEIAEAMGDYEDDDMLPEVEANARLIAAAPDLYTALEEASALVDALSGGRGNLRLRGQYISLEEAIARARAALSKARGE